MNPLPIPTIILHNATPVSPTQDFTIQGDSDGAIRPQHLQQQLQQHHSHYQSKRLAWTCEQNLIDEITAMFGPHLVEIAMKQDTVYMSSDSSCVQLRSQGQITDSSNSMSSPSTISESACVATMLVPGLEPRAVNLSHENGVFSAVRLAWLQELRIVYRCCGALSSGIGVGGRMRKQACFLHVAVFSSSVSRWSRSGVDQEKEEEENEVAVVDLSYCETLEELWIEDLDKNGRPHRLQSWKTSVKDLFTTAETGGDIDGKGNETGDLVPFARDQGLVLPGRLKSLSMVGLSASKFNFGWLRSTPRLEALNIHGMRIHIDSQPLPPPTTSPLWDIEGVFLPQLKHLSIHYAPAHHFRFEMLKHCPRLMFLDVRDLCPGTVREALVHPGGELGTASASRGGHGGGSIEESGGGESIFATKISTCRFEFLHPNHIHHLQGGEMVKLLEWYLPRLRHLHLDGVPVKLTIAITTGPPTLRKQQRHHRQQSRSNERLEITPAAAAASKSETTEDAITRVAKLPWLERVLTREKVTVQEVLEYRLVPFRIGEVKGEQGDRMVERLGMETHAVQYTIGTKTWQRIIS
ncbi:hypothetical protein EC957_004939 [Mortierella hygrophila]|uniref:Uncharacterized protein n=1 Tax=Mortierella hygrophila TaxID=979708 RepID=A0A9P6F0W7_9FUNG|nr:hypothetical protein EC957_004939 [Mortierella hygrophila]